MLRRFNTPAVLVIALMVAVPLLAVGEAQAGCLTEQDDCSNCARGALWEAMKKMSFGGIRRANMALMDCSIDLYHCMVLGSHHNYACAL